MKIVLLFFLPLVSSLDCPICKDNHGREDCHFHTCKNGEFCEIKEGHHSHPEGTCHHSDKFYEHCPSGVCHDDHSSYCYCCTTPDCVRNVTDKHVSPQQVSPFNCPSCTFDHSGSVDCSEKTHLCDPHKQICELRNHDNKKLEGSCHDHKDLEEKCQDGHCHAEAECFCCTNSTCVKSAINAFKSPKVSGFQNDHSFSCYQCMNAISQDQCQTVTCHSHEHCFFRVNGDSTLQSGCEPHRDCKHQSCHHAHNMLHAGFHCEQCCKEEHCILTTFNHLLPRYAATTSLPSTTETLTTAMPTSATTNPTTKATVAATIHTGCFDTHNLPCQQIFCADPDFSKLYCRKTCSHCTTQQLTTTPLAKQTTKQPSMSTTAKEITTRPVTTQTAKLTTTATRPPTTTAAAVPRTTTAHSSGVKHHECYQCGDIGSTTYCSGLELVLPPLKPCPASMPYCVTDIFVVGDGTYETIRRCANRDRCTKDWWEGTSDRSTCVDADPTTLFVKQTCTYCCTKDGCNKDKVPEKATFFKP